MFISLKALKGYIEYMHVWYNNKNNSIFDDSQLQN